MAPAEESDSGMESLSASSKDLTPEKPTAGAITEDDEEEVEDESLTERLWGLTEMFPEPVRKAAGSTCSATCASAKGLYSFLRVSSWVFFSSAVILFAPVIFETERIQVEEMQKQQNRQLLLGPNAAMVGGAGPQR
ncbi:mitochondrial import receptor subunit TOM22 homolog [Neocloeon triangulifer]|uniref:mitochondrial import receptor subunit TOM22 homolog n=1 Tax=Neocloeon triangulifer TaxID=2078957 RepID=UPI00286EEDBD|nr:mitochondrial import receptor subunit TOM22 homolog [Neocloeon triangulifer]